MAMVKLQVYIKVSNVLGDIKNSFMSVNVLLPLYELGKELN